MVRKYNLLFLSKRALNDGGKRWMHAGPLDKTRHTPSFRIFLSQRPSGPQIILQFWVRRCSEFHCKTRKAYATYLIIHLLGLTFSIPGSLQAHQGVVKDRIVPWDNAQCQSMLSSHLKTIRKPTTLSFLWPMEAIIRWYMSHNYSSTIISA